MEESSLPNPTNPDAEDVHLVIDESFLNRLELEEDAEYQEAKELFENIIEDRNNRIRVIFYALLERYIQKMEDMEDFLNQAEQRLERNIDSLSEEDLLKYYKMTSERLQSVVRDMKEILNYINEQ